VSEGLPSIVQAGHPVLRAEALPVPAEMLGTQALRDLVAVMTEVMRKAPGVGLAAPQLGLALRLVILEDAEALMSRLTPADRATRGRAPFPLQVIANPVLTTVGTGRATFFEGCLSVPGYMALVERDLEVEVRGLDAEGDPIVWRASGWAARILQHEIDHTRGMLYLDRMIARTFSANAEAQARWLAMPVSEVRAALGAPAPRPSGSGEGGHGGL
jgi:peptide deformylase